MKLPADEKIIARLERNHGKLVGNKIESESFFDSLSSKISQLSSSKGIYSILNEGLEFLKAQQEDINDVLGNNKDHVHKARIRKLEKRLEVVFFSFHLRRKFNSTFFSLQIRSLIGKLKRFRQKK